MLNAEKKVKHAVAKSRRGKLKKMYNDTYGSKKKIRTVRETQRKVYFLLKHRYPDLYDSLLYDVIENDIDRKSSEVIFDDSKSD